VTEHRVGVEQAIMGREVGRALRRGMLFKIGWRGANDVTPNRQAPFHECGIGRRRRHDREIEPLANEVYHHVAGAQID
jgi:hypothetical protein